LRGYFSSSHPQVLSNDQNLQSSTHIFNQFLGFTTSILSEDATSHPVSHILRYRCLDLHHSNHYQANQNEKRKEKAKLTTKKSLQEQFRIISDT